MKDFIISVESTCDLTHDFIQKHNISVLHMDFFIGEQAYNTATDTVDTVGLYQKMREGNKTSTSQVNETLYEEYFEELIKQGKPIIHLAFSSGLSSTYYSAEKACKAINIKHGQQVYLINSLAGCTGQGMLAMLVSEYAQKANTIEEVTEYAEQLKHKLAHIFIIDNLKYLVAGGRIKPAMAFLGNMLNIKPILHIDEEGKIVSNKKVISKKRAIMELADKCIKEHDPNCNTIFISHSDCMNDVKTLQDLILKGTNIMPCIQPLGPVLGSHSGPDALAVFYVCKNKRA